jgi:adenosylhomocysteine nucleosidase
MYPCLLFALRREAQPFYRHFDVRRRLTSAPCPAWLCGTSLQRVLVLESGVGPERCGRALRWLTESYLPEQGLLQPLFLVAAGFAGALREECRVGDVILATEVLDHRGRRWPRDPEAGEEGREVSWRHGRVLSTPHLVGDPGEKRRLGERFGAVAVDMESAFVARFCAERGIPLSCVRVISDEVHTPLSPQLVRLLSGPEVRIPRLLASLARSPRLVLELWRLARDTRAAAQRLARALVQLLDSSDGSHATATVLRG